MQKWDTQIDQNGGRKIEKVVAKNRLEWKTKIAKRGTPKSTKVGAKICQKRGPQICNFVLKSLYKRILDGTPKSTKIGRLKWLNWGTKIQNGAAPKSKMGGAKNGQSAAQKKPKVTPKNGQNGIPKMQIWVARRQCVSVPNLSSQCDFDHRWPNDHG